MENNTRLAIMQPYVFPYIGYFQLVNVVDQFVFYDDVNYIKNGWINRNRLLFSGIVKYFTIPLSGVSPFLKINQISVQYGEHWRKKLVKAVSHSYSKAPHFKVVYDLFSEIIFSTENNISELAKRSVVMISEYLGLTTQFVMSSCKYENSHLNSVERILDICRREETVSYYNLPSGISLYDSEIFRSHEIELHFISPQLSPYTQYAEKFQPALSILDVLMFNDKNTTRKMLDCKEIP